MYFIAILLHELMLDSHAMPSRTQDDVRKIIRKR